MCVRCHVYSCLVSIVYKVLTRLATRDFRARWALEISVEVEYCFYRASWITYWKRLLAGELTRKNSFMMELVCMRQKFQNGWCIETKKCKRPRIGRENFYPVASSAHKRWLYLLFVAMPASILCFANGLSATWLATTYFIINGFLLRMNINIFVR